MKVKKNTILEKWSFGGNSKYSDELLDLVIKGCKTATSSLYFSEGKISQIGEKSYITNSKGKEKVLIEIVNVEIKPFKDVDNNFAKKEGEGDLSLDYWRKAHKNFFTDELHNINREFNEDILIVCEEFKVLKIFK